jgi:hypothetical protein
MPEGRVKLKQIIKEYTAGGPAVFVFDESTNSVVIDKSLAPDIITSENLKSTNNYFTEVNNKIFKGQGKSQYVYGEYTYAEQVDRDLASLNKKRNVINQEIQNANARDVFK